MFYVLLKFLDFYSLVEFFVITTRHFFWVISTSFPQIKYMFLGIYLCFLLANIILFGLL
jgi:hypothetical protein